MPEEKKPKHKKKSDEQPKIKTIRQAEDEKGKERGKGGKGTGAARSNIAEEKGGEKEEEEKRSRGWEGDEMGLGKGRGRGAGSVDGQRGSQRGKGAEKRRTDDGPYPTASSVQRLQPTVIWAARRPRA